MESRPSKATEAASANADSPRVGQGDKDSKLRGPFDFSRGDTQTVALLEHVVCLDRSAVQTDQVILGMTTLSPVSKTYVSKVPFAFNSKIEKVVLDLK
jgi:hypothetical protein